MIPEYISKMLKHKKLETSTRQNKKLMVVSPSGKLVHFGDTRYEHYRDQTGIWAALDHNDDKRREKYQARASKIVDKNGDLTYMNPESPNAWSYWVLW